MKHISNIIRVSHFPQIPCKPYIVHVNNENEAYLLEQTLANQHLFLFDNNFIPDYSNIILVEMWDDDVDEDEDGLKWVDYWNESEQMDWAELSKEYLSKTPSREVRVTITESNKYINITAGIDDPDFVFSWECLQQIKDEYFPDVKFIEVYPKTDEIINKANERHIIHIKGMDVPGFDDLEETLINEQHEVFNLWGGEKGFKREKINKLNS